MLPPWAPYLTAPERCLAALLEKSLLTLLFVVPGSGLLLVAGESDWLPAHIVAQWVLLAALVGHVGLVLRHTVVHRDPPDDADAVAPTEFPSTSPGVRDALRPARRHGAASRRHAVTAVAIGVAGEAVTQGFVTSGAYSRI